MTIKKEAYENNIYDFLVTGLDSSAYYELNQTIQGTYVTLFASGNNTNGMKIDFFWTIEKEDLLDLINRKQDIANNDIKELIEEIEKIKD